MTDEQKRIDEMAILLQDIKYTLPDDEDTRYRYFTRLDKQSAKEIAKALIAAGYRKQSDTAREFAGKVLKIGSKRPLCLFNEYKEGYIDCIENIKKIAAQYGVEVE